MHREAISVPNPTRECVSTTGAAPTASLVLKQELLQHRSGEQEKGAPLLQSAAVLVSSRTEPSYPQPMGNSMVNWIFSLTFCPVTLVLPPKYAEVQYKP